MGEIRIVGPSKTCGYPYPLCKKSLSTSINFGLDDDGHLLTNLSHFSQNYLILLVQDTV